MVALSFTGSYSVGQQIYEQLARRMARAQMEMGGKNPTIVLADADLELAATLVAKAGFGLTGQACTATSRAIVEASVLDDSPSGLWPRRAPSRSVLDWRPEWKWGRLVSKQQLAGNLEYVDGAVRRRRKLLYGGSRLTDNEFAQGYFMAPTVLGNVSPKMKIACEEVFGPVVAVISAKDFDDALAIANGLRWDSPRPLSPAI